MTVFKNTFEGGSNGTHVTLANSGGGSGDAFDSMFENTGTSSSIIFSNAFAMHGSLSCKFTSFGTQYLTKNITSASAAAVRVYFLWTGSSTDIDICAFDNTGSLVLRIFFNATTRVLSVSNSAGTTLITMTTALSASTWYRIEMQAVAGTTTGHCSLQLYAGDSTSALESKNSSLNVNTGAAYTDARIGTIEGASNNTVYFDDFAVNDTGVAIGPPSTNISFSRVFKWNVLTAVTSFTRIFKWNVRQTITPFTRTFKWNVIAGVIVSRILKWNTIQTIASVRTFKWNTKIVVSPFTRIIRWNTRIQISLTRSFIWRVIQTIILTKIFRWNTRSILNVSRTVKWNVIGGLLITRVFLWETFVLWTKVINPSPEVWTLINQNNAAWTTEEVNSTSWR